MQLAQSTVTLAGPARMVGEVTVGLDVLRGLVADRSEEVVAAL